MRGCICSGIERVAPHTHLLFSHRLKGQSHKGHLVGKKLSDFKRRAINHRLNIERGELKCILALQLRLSGDKQLQEFAPTKKRKEML